MGLNRCTWRECRLDLQGLKANSGSVSLSVELPKGAAGVHSRPQAACWDPNSAFWDVTLPRSQALQDRVLSFCSNCLSGCFAQVRNVLGDGFAGRPFAPHNLE